MSTLDQTWRIKMLYDGLCPVCRHEVNMLKRRNGAGFVAFEDIAAPEFDPSRYGLTMPQVIGAMHGVKRDGTVLKGVDVFIDIYRNVGLNWLAAVIAFRPTRPLMNLGYRVFAKLRPRLSKFNGDACTTDRCSPVDTRSTKTSV